MPSGRAAGVALAAVCAGALAIALASSTACVPHQCDPSSATFDLAKQGTSFTDPEGFTVLSSGPYDGAWIPFPAMVTITVTYPAGFQLLLQPSVAVSTGQDQDSGATSITASGQVDQITDPSSTGFNLNNGSCADYFVWFAVTGTFTPAVGGAGSDASAE